VLAVLGVVLAVEARNFYIDRLSGQLAEQAELAGAAVAPVLAAGGGETQVDPIVKRLGSGVDARLTVVAADGTVLGDSIADPRTMENHAGRPEIIAAHARGAGEAQRHSVTLDRDFLYVAMPISGSSDAVARVALPLGEVNTTVRRIQEGVAVVALLAAILATAVSFFVAGRITKPLDALRRHASAVAAGQLDVAVDPAPTQELGEVGRAFNLMTARLYASMGEVERARARLEAMLANLDEGIVITDAGGIVVRLNHAAARMLGMTEEAVQGRPFARVAPDHDIADLLTTALATSTAQFSTIDTGRNGLIVAATAQPVTGGGERLGLIVLRDITELRRLERVRREFVANVSHELRTPLTSIKALVETLAAGARDDPEVADDFLSRIDEEVDRLTGLVEELLDLARLEAGRVVLQIEPCDPVAVMVQAAERLRPHAERAGLTLRVEADAPTHLPEIAVDRARIEQVLINLIHNAIKFTPAGGSIVVDAHEEPDGVVIAVRDSGVGIAPEELPRLFERFYKTDKARGSTGTGLGLAIAKHIVQAHGGTIWAESAPGQGTTFFFTAPRAVEM
jgi:two-component system phosphate regulon sensor histidine kinase PhoR